MKVVYVGPYLSSTAGSAAFQRAMGISRSLIDAGGTMIIGTGDPVSDPVGITVEVPGLQVQHVRRTRHRRGKLSTAVDWFSFADDVIAWLHNFEGLDAVILYGGGAHLVDRVIRWSRDVGVSIVADQVEWYDPRHQPMGRLGPFARDLERGMKSAYSRTGNCIVISTFLETHFAGQRCRTVLVPPTTDVENLAWSPRRKERDALQFVYAGSPGKKDHLRAIVDGLEIADPSGTRTHLDVYGPDPSIVPRLLGRTELPSYVSAHGRTDRESVLGAVAAADYVPLVRPNERFAKAGFPTKIVESLSSGTPVICNATSDLSSYIRDGETGWLLRQPTAEDFALAVSRALAVPPPQRETMRRLARQQAERSFDHRQYTTLLADFFSSLRSVC